jgi:hypothetical protein
MLSRHAGESETSSGKNVFFFNQRIDIDGTNEKHTGYLLRGIWRIPHLDSFLPGEHIRLSPFKTIPAQVNAIVVWGQRPSAQKPVAMAQSAGLPVIRLEDGFIRSLGLGVQDCPPSPSSLIILASITTLRFRARSNAWSKIRQAISRWQLKRRR